MICLIKQGIAMRTDSTLIPSLSYFHCVFILWLKIKMCHKLSYACPLIMHFLENWGVSTIYLPTKFQLHRFINNGDLLADKNRLTDTHTDTHTDTQAETDTFTIYHIGSSKKRNWLIYNLNDRIGDNDPNYRSLHRLGWVAEVSSSGLRGRVKLNRCSYRISIN